jgi:GR25 family glycosyltransferase involved in LPS biosynthesis
MKHILLLLATLQLSNALIAGPGCIHDDRLPAIVEEQVQARNSLLQADSLPQLKGVYYINLPTSALRRGRISNLVKMTAPKNMMIERFEAVGKSSAQKADLTEMTTHGIHEYMGKTYQGGTLWATVGVYLSHTRLLKKIMNEHKNSTGDDMYLILEDDAILQPDWHAKLMKILPSVPKDWDMLRIGYGTDSNLRCEDKINNNWYENRAPTRNKGNDKAFYAGNTAYLVRPNHIPTMLKQISEMPVLDVDGTMISKEGGMRVYGVADPLVYHGNGLGLSDRIWAGINPLSSLVQTEAKVETQPASLADVIDSGVGKASVQESQSDKAFEMFGQDLA